MNTDNADTSSLTRMPPPNPRDTRAWRCRQPKNKDDALNYVRNGLFRERDLRPEPAYQARGRVEVNCRQGECIGIHIVSDPVEDKCGAESECRPCRCKRICTWGQKKGAGGIDENEAVLDRNGTVRKTHYPT